MSSNLSSFDIPGPTDRGDDVDQPLSMPPVVVKELSGPHTNIDPVDVVTGVVNAGTAALG